MVFLKKILLEAICFFLLVQSAVFARPQALFYPGARFPGSKLAPINPPYIIYLYQSSHLNPSNGLFKGSIIEGGLNSDGSGTYTADIQAWRKAGNLVVTRRYVDENLISKFDGSENIYDNNLYSHYYHPWQTSGSPDGISIDEFENMNSLPQYMAVLSVLKKIKSDKPDYLICAFSTLAPGVLQLLAGNGNEGIDVIMLECYAGHNTPESNAVPYITKYVNSIKSIGISSKTIITLSATGWNRSNWVLKPELFDKWIALVRKLDPQEPGIGLAPLSGNPEQNKLLSGYYKGYEAAIRKNFFDPAPIAHIILPFDGQTVNGTIEIQANATPNINSERPIVTYRFFIDNECVQVSGKPSFNWNTSGFSSGSHILTVHAVDDDYLTGVDQITVNITTNK